MSTLERALEIAVDAHRGQKDKAGAPYILHPLRLMLQMKSLDERIAAVLHDVVEDSDWTLAQLRAEGFSDRVLSAVDALTSRENEPYADFIRRAASDSIARIIKVADLKDNLNLSRIAKPTGRDFTRLEKYRRALTMLEVEK